MESLFKIKVAHMNLVDSLYKIYNNILCCYAAAWIYVQ